MSERGRARGRGRSRPAVPGESSTEPSGAAGITASTGEVIILCLLFQLIDSLNRHQPPRHWHH